MSRALALLRGHTILALILLLALFILGIEIARPGTVTPLWISNALLFAAPLAILGAGQTLVMLTGGIDLSVASVATGSAYILATNAVSGDGVALALALSLGLIVGIVNGLGVAVLRVQPLVMTLGTGLMVGGAMTVYSQYMLASQPHVPAIIQTLGAGKILGLVPVDLFLWAVIAALMLFALQRTGFGRLLYAVGDNREACHLAGIRVWRVLFVDYVLCALLAAIAGLVAGRRNQRGGSQPRGCLSPSLRGLRDHRRNLHLRRTGRIFRHDRRRAHSHGAHEHSHAARCSRTGEANPLRRDHSVARRRLRALDGVGSVFTSS